MNLTALITFLEETFQIRVKPMDVPSRTSRPPPMLAYVEMQRRRAMAEASAAPVEFAAEPRAEVLEATADEPLRSFPTLPRPRPADRALDARFLGITIAVLVGGELTEFRYVGF